MSKSRFMWINIEAFEYNTSNGRNESVLIVKNINITCIKQFKGFNRTTDGRNLTEIEMYDGEIIEAFHDINTVVARIEECELFLKQS